MICNICPRRCGAERTETYGGGFCRMPAVPVIARAGLHLWEEPVLSGTRGSGAVFFSGCSLGCVYCQNHTISAEGVGKAVTTERLREIYFELLGQGAHNIELVTPTHFLPWILPSLEPKLPVPMVYNCGGYERVETLRLLEGKVDVWLPDLKYSDGALARELSGAEDYFPVACDAIREMFRQTGRPVYDGNGLMRRGVIVRHLVLPGHADDSCRVLDVVWDVAGDVPISVMNQYTPNEAMRVAGGKLARAVTDEEYEHVLDHADDLGFTTLFWQEGGAVDESFTPAFDTTGVLRAADA